MGKVFAVPRRIPTRNQRYLTVGRRYEVVPMTNEFGEGYFQIQADNGKFVISSWQNGEHLDGPYWQRVDSQVEKEMEELLVQALEQAHSIVKKLTSGSYDIARLEESAKIAERRIGLALYVHEKSKTQSVCKLTCLGNTANCSCHQLCKVV